MTDALLDAVEDLTAPRNVKVTTDDGHTWATEDPLLTQLADAVSSTLNSGSGSGGAPWARNVLDSGALHQAAIIRSTIGDWCRMVGVQGRREPADGLRAWYAARIALPETQRETDPFYIGQLRAWANQIRNMTNPPKTIEIVAACPICDQGTYTNDLGDVVRNPLQLTYRPESGSIWQDARAICRACQTVWDDQWKLRALRHDIDAKETAEWTA